MALWLWIVIGFAGLGLAYFIAKKNVEYGMPFWRSLFFSVLLILGIAALILAALSKSN